MHTNKISKISDKFFSYFSRRTRCLSPAGGANCPENRGNIPGKNRQLIHYQYKIRSCYEMVTKPAGTCIISGQFVIYAFN